jgi:hypothetical protein
VATYYISIYSSGAQPAEWCPTEYDSRKVSAFSVGK